LQRTAYAAAGYFALWSKYLPEMRSVLAGDAIPGAHELLAPEL